MRSIPVLKIIVAVLIVFFVVLPGRISITAQQPAAGNASAPNSRDELAVAEALTVQSRPPRVFLLNGSQLQITKKHIQNGDLAIAAAWAKLEADAKKALTLRPFSVTNKTPAPPSGDKHDYMSQAPYFWPDPAKPNGLPYMRKDGERNPEINKITDHAELDKLEAAVETL